MCQVKAWAKRCAQARRLAAGGFDVVDAEEGEDGSGEFEERAALAKEKDAEAGSRDRKQVGERCELGGFEIAEEPEVEEIGQGGAEKAGIGDASVGLPRKRTPGVRKIDGEELVDGDGESDERAKDEIPSGHGERVVVVGDALAEDNVHGEAERAAHGDGVTKKSGRTAGHTGGRGKDHDAGEGNGHADGDAEGEAFQAKEDGKAERVDRREADNDGGVGNVGMVEADREAELVDGDAEEAEIEEDPEIQGRVTGGAWEEEREIPRFARNVVVMCCGGAAEDGEAGAERGDGKHEEAGADDAERRKGESGKIAQTPFDDEEVQSPDSHERGDRESDEGARWSAGDGRVYAHGIGPE